MTVTDSYNRYPDEKGTESEPTRRSARHCRSYNRYPDEKGTERPDMRCMLVGSHKLQPLPPMKRGLKVLVAPERLRCLNRLQPLPR